MSNDTEEPKINVSVYGVNGPAAATFDRGARTLEQIQEVIDARNELSRDPLRNGTGK